MRSCAFVAVFLLGCATLACAQTAEQLATGLKSPVVATRTAAARELWMMSDKNPAAVKSAIPALTDAVLDTDLNVRYMTITALKNVGPAAKAAVPNLAKALDTFPGGTPALQGPPRYFVDVREVAAEALGAIGADAKAAIPALQKATKDPVPPVRSAAEAALQKIQGKG